MDTQTLDPKRPVVIKIVVADKLGNTPFSEELDNIPLNLLVEPGKTSPSRLMVATYLEQIALGYGPTDPV